MDCQVVELRRRSRRSVFASLSTWTVKSLTEVLTTGTAGDWQDDGACTSANHKTGFYVTAHYESKSVPLEVPVKTPVSAAPTHKNSRLFHAAQ